MKALQTLERAVKAHPYESAVGGAREYIRLMEHADEMDEESEHIRYVAEQGGDDLATARTRLHEIAGQASEHSNFEPLSRVRGSH